MIWFFPTAISKIRRYIYIYFCVSKLFKRRRLCKLFNYHISEARTKINIKMVNVTICHTKSIKIRSIVKAWFKPTNNGPNMVCFLFIWLWLGLGLIPKFLFAQRFFSKNDFFFFLKQSAGRVRVHQKDW